MVYVHDKHGGGSFRELSQFGLSVYADDERNAIAATKLTSTATDSKRLVARDGGALIGLLREEPFSFCHRRGTLRGQTLRYCALPDRRWQCAWHEAGPCGQGVIVRCVWSPVHLRDEIDMDDVDTVA